ncbi:olfactory receptor 6Q1-like [Lissotriton helveticus]
MAAQQDDLGAPLDPEELRYTIFNLSNGKSPGPDGLPAEFYKAASDILIPHLVKMYTAATDDFSLPPTLNEATLISLLKPDRDSERMGSYRPLALLNTDYKILASTLARRLAPIVPTLLHHDQNGFVPTRHTSHNIRRLFRIQEYATRQWLRAGCLVLDLEKAFDSVEWPYLRAVMDKFDLGDDYETMMVSPTWRSTANQTTVTEFILVGFPTRWEYEIFLFLVFLLIYILTVTENIIIVFLICWDYRLHKPMYIFLINLSIIEIGYISVTLPKLLVNMLSGKKSISYTGCISQLYGFVFLGATECFLLAAMAFDRYAAICNALRYQAIMTRSMCARLAACCWLNGFLTPALPILLLCLQTFCGPNIINHFFCDASPLLRLSCSDTRVKQLVDILVSMVVLLSSLLVIALSYGRIITTILAIPSTTGRLKAFSTCTSHLTVVVIFYGTMVFVYSGVTNLLSMDLSKVVSVFYTVVIPFFNPMIYSLRNKEVKQAFYKDDVDHERIAFNAARQEPGESLPNFITRLQSLVHHCHFNTFTDEEAVRLRVIEGCSKPETKRKILQGQFSLKEIIRRADVGA